MPIDVIGSDVIPASKFDFAWQSILWDVRETPIHSPGLIMQNFLHYFYRLGQKIRIPLKFLLNKMLQAPALSQEACAPAPSVQGSVLSDDAGCKLPVFAQMHTSFLTTG